MLLICLFVQGFLAQAQGITGKVTEENGEPLVGAAVIIKETNDGTITDVNGAFVLDVKEGTPLLIKFIGFTTIEINASNNMQVSMREDVESLEEVIVTGVFDKRSTMESSIAISTLNAKALEKQVPVSTGDIFLNTPGVYVNSSAGQTRNQVYTRGLSVGSSVALSSGTNGYYYLSLQEDGLPVTAISDATFVSDLFFRSDATVTRLESVRGGSSAITSVNAPGGIFNFISKNGAEESKEIRTQFGLEGNGNNPYFRTDLNYGGRVNETLMYNIGGFYRVAEGSRYAGYPLNKGGQVKGNVTKLYDKGSIRVFAKYLNDINGGTMVLPAVGYDDIKLAPGVNFEDSYLLKKGSVDVPDGKGGSNVFDPTKPEWVRDYTVGFNWTHDLSDSWTIKNNFKYANRDYEANTNSSTSITPLNNASTYFFTGIYGPPGSVNMPGTVIFSDPTTNQSVATVDFAPPFGGPPSINVTSSNLPEAVSNSLMYNGSRLHRGSLNEFMNQFSASKKWDNVGVNAGVFYSKSKAVNFAQTAPILALTTISDQPNRLDVVYQANDGNTYQLTDANGYMKLGGSFNFSDLSYEVDQLAYFFGNNISLVNNKLNVDWGFRYETSNVTGTNNRSVSNPVNSSGGLDGDPLTVYDNFSQILDPANEVSFDKNIRGLSVSGGVNYRINDKNAVYVRYARGKKAPDLAFYGTYTNQFAIDNLSPKNQIINQFEAAYKLRTERVRVTITPFLSYLDDVTVITLTADENNQFYNPTPQLNSVKTQGLEMELGWFVTQNLSLNGNATLQNSEYSNWKVWNLGDPGRDDDVLTDYSGNEAENTPSLMMTITPKYETDKYFAMFQLRYMGERQANQPNAYTIPGFTTVNFSAGYDITHHLTASVNINNLTNTIGIMSSFAPGDVTQAFNPQRVTADVVAADPNATHPVIAIQPRSYFLTLAYKF